MRTLVTGSAGFIGFHLCRKLLQSGNEVAGVDNFTDYYDVSLKRARNSILEAYENFQLSEISIEDQTALFATVDSFKPDVIIHLAAQAGVRYSLENPKAYLDTNINGTFHVLEAAKKQKVQHLLMASTSSVYGGNKVMPFKETEKADSPMTIYAATKKANENLAHVYSHLWGLPITMFRFFTVYGPWGRPDLALYKFVDAILDDRSIDIYNHGDMYRDFTYVDDLVNGIELLVDCIPSHISNGTKIQGDSISDIAPFRVVNIGNSNKVKLLDFIKGIENALKVEAKKNFMDIQMGDVPATWADATLLKNLTGYKPNTSFQDGINEFVNWFREYYKR